MPFFTIKTLLVPSLLLLQGVSAAPLAQSDALSSDTRPHWEGNTLTIPGGKIHKRGLNPGQEIEGWLKEALRETPDLKLSPMYSTPEMEEYIDMLREEVALEKERAQGQEQKVVG